MNVITAAALANFKKNKSRNLLIGIAIALTALLLTILPTVGLGVIEIQKAAANNFYPVYHGMYRDVNEETAKKLLKEEAFKAAGLREDPAVIYYEGRDAVISMVAVDDITVRLSKTELSEGDFPQTADEIVVSPKIMELMGFKGGIGDRITVPFQPVTEEGLGMVKEKEFIISGLVADSENAVRSGMYTSIVSHAFAKEIVPPKEHEYRVYFRLEDMENTNKNLLEEKMTEIGESYGIQQKDIVYNSEYLWANFTDPETYKAGFLIMMLIILTGVLTIYGIYYVSMLDKVQEYGKLKAIGATKRQLNGLVFREGFAVAGIAVPLGILAGIGASLLFIRCLIYLDVNTDTVLAEQMKMVYENHEVHVVKPSIIGLSLLVSLLTVYCALRRPMRAAARVTPVEAIRYRENGGFRKKNRRGFENMNIRRLTAVNLGRNKKRTAVTIAVLGAAGVLFMAAATVLSCFDPETVTKEEIRGTARVKLDSWEGDEMHPERELHEIQKDNPLNEELEKRILQIDGVEKIDKISCLNVGIKEEGVREEDGSPLQTDIFGLSDKALNELEKYVKEGSLKEKSLEAGNGIILQESIMINWPVFKAFKPGDKISLELYDGERKTEKDFILAAIVDAPRSLGGYTLSMPDKSLRGFSERDLTYIYDIYVRPGKETQAEEELRQITAEEGFLSVDTYRSQYEAAEKSIGIIRYACYGFLLVLGLIGILNLINTIMNSVYVRRRELGMLQAVGMSGRQTVNMLQLEGLFYTAGTLLVSLGLGNAAGYLIFRWAKRTGMMGIKDYIYPLVPTVVFILTVLAVQMLVTYLVNKSFRKHSLIDRIRFS